MIAKLQKRFVRIAMLSVLLVMLLLSVIVDVTSLVYHRLYFFYPYPEKILPNFGTDDEPLRKCGHIQ